MDSHFLLSFSVLNFFFKYRHFWMKSLFLLKFLIFSSNYFQCFHIYEINTEAKTNM